jgi:nucleoside-diphosphate-sugar epimerase
MLWIIVASVLGLAALYLNHVNSAMKRVPEEAHKASPHRWTIEEIESAYKKSLESPVDTTTNLPPKQSRRYVVVGGSGTCYALQPPLKKVKKRSPKLTFSIGLVGGWIVSHLLARGEDPASLRVLDRLSPTKEILDRGVTYVKTDITDELAVSTSFEKPWPESISKLPLTVFHTAAAIRPQDRLEMFLPYCSKVNIDGTKNVMNAARKAGASCFVSTSSGSVSLHKPNFWIAPWSKLPSRAVQVISDSSILPQRHDQFFGNYAVTKIEAERIVRSADDQSSNFRTGCIRPANGIYGIGSDAAMTITGVYLRNGGSPTWVRPVIQSFVNAENVSIAHLLYEQRLLEQNQPGSTLPNIGGQAFVVTDPNPPISFSDIYTLLSTLSKTPVSFPTLQPAPLLVFSYFVELYCVIQHKYLPWLLPRLTGDLAQMQPSLFAISGLFCFADDSRARKPPERGGLGYEPPITTLEGMCKQLVDWNAKAEAKLVGAAGKSAIEITEDGVDVNLVSPETKI